MTRVAIVHPTTLLGKELREALGRRPDLGLEVRLLSAHEEEIGTVTEVAGSAAFVDRFDPDLLGDEAVVFFCGEIERDRPLVASMPPAPLSVLLSRGAGAGDGRIEVAGSEADAPTSGAVVSPHAAVVGLVHLLRALAPLGPREALVTAIQPASQFGEVGIEELFGETRGILAFSGERKHPVFGRQLAFNLLPAAEDDGVGLSGQVAAALGAMEPVCRVRLLQGSAFHGVALSVELRFSKPVAAREVASRLAADPAVETVRAAKRLGPIDAATSDRILVGEVRADAEGRVWLWAVLDNLTVGGVLNGIALAERRFGSAA
ncbi:MAG: Asd/ArgC dimerization domain-containing protein [Thermoanaerobaculia bacterium]|nr:Asd/ArgC dimerization domain-containing protein [Thermoanaerobaculia bacterium]